MRRKTGGRARRAGWPWPALIVLGAGAAHAQVPIGVSADPATPLAAVGSLDIRTLELGDWARAVEAMQTDPGWQGRTVRVVVVDPAGRRARCGRYRLALDAHAERAFERGACDPASGATALRLIHRAALFETDAGFPRPRTIRVRAVETREGVAEGAATPPAGTELRCHLAIRPYVVDLLNGRRVRATPDRFELRPVGDGVSVVAAGEEWRARSSAVRIRYELIDRASGEVVLRDQARLECSRGDEDPLRRDEGWQATIQGRDVIWLRSGQAYRGRAWLARTADDRGTCGGEGGVESWYAVRFEVPHRLVLGLHAEQGAALYVRRGSIFGPEVLCRSTSVHPHTVDRVLLPGTYFVAVDGLNGLARYRLSAFFEPVPAAPLAGDPPHDRGSVGGSEVASPHEGPDDDGPDDGSSRWSSSRGASVSRR